MASRADAVIFDLEDSVAASAREKAIGHVSAFLADRRSNDAVSVWVRVNDAVERLPAIQALCQFETLTGFVVPKFESPEQCAGWRKPIMAIIETPRGILDAARITSAAVDDLHGISLGPEDLSTALGVAPSLDSLMYSASVVVMAAHAAGVCAYSCPGGIGEFRDLVAWRAILDAGRRIGSHGGLCIHPAQVEPANSAFSPTIPEIEWAQRICAAWDSASGSGVIALEGKMIDLPVMQRARNMLLRRRT
jgi:citrate lyase subunit beta/citryl-CoA lyase